MDQKNLIIISMSVVIGILLSVSGFFIYGMFTENAVTTSKIGKDVPTPQEEKLIVPPLDTVSGVSKTETEQAAIPQIASTSIDVPQAKPSTVKTETQDAPKIKPEISKFTQTVVSLRCFGKNDVESWTSGGSGISLYYDDGLHYILTNAHVVRAYDGTFGGCWVYFPTEDGIFYQSAYWAGKAYLYDQAPVVLDGVTYGGGENGEEGIDVAFLQITDSGKDAIGNQLPPVTETRFPDLLSISGKTCTSKNLAIGDEVLLLGYPGVGGQNITATDGIISGFDGYSNEYIKTSAKIEHGNSGGLAIRATDGCLIGMPTLSFTGEMESIGSILSYSFIKPFVNAYDAGFGAVDVNNEIDPLTLDLYPNLLKWTKVSKNPHQALTGIFSEALTFSGVCDGYADSACVNERSIQVQSNTTGDSLWTASVGPYTTTGSAWKPEYPQVAAYYDAYYKDIGFTRNATLFAPDNGLALPVYDYEKNDTSWDGGMLRYARIVGDTIQFIVLDIEVTAEYADTCVGGATNCPIVVKEEYALFVGKPISLNVFLALERTTKKNIADLSWLHPISSLIQALR